MKYIDEEGMWEEDMEEGETNGKGVFWPSRTEVVKGRASTHVENRFG